MLGLEPLEMWAVGTLLFVAVLPPFVVLLERFRFRRTPAHRRFVGGEAAAMRAGFLRALSYAVPTALLFTAFLLIARFELPVALYPLVAVGFIFAGLFDRGASLVRRFAGWEVVDEYDAWRNARAKELGSR